MTIHATDNIYPLYKRQTPEEWNVESGMTKREYFAILALQGLVTHYGYGEAPAVNIQELASWAVKLADTLVDELNRSLTNEI